MGLEEEVRKEDRLTEGEGDGDFDFDLLLVGIFVFKGDKCFLGGSLERQTPQHPRVFLW